MHTRARPEPAVVAAWDADRRYEALLRLRHGASIDEVAREIPNLMNGWRPGVSARAARGVLNSAQRTLLTAVLMDRRPPRLPDELWPPDHVRAAVRREGRHRGEALLRAWLHPGTVRAPRAARARRVPAEPPA
jgi:hypothetical protein